MSVVVEKGHDHETDWSPVSVYVLSQSGDKGFPPESTRPNYPPAKARERRVAPSHRNVEAGGSGGWVRRLWTGPAGGRYSSAVAVETTDQGGVSA